MRKKIGECLIQAGLITEDDLQVALAEHKRTGERVGAVLVRLNLATEKQITKALAYQLGFPYASLAEEPPDPAAIVADPEGVALKRICVAVEAGKEPAHRRDVGPAALQPGPGPRVPDRLPHPPGGGDRAPTFSRRSRTAIRTRRSRKYTGGAGTCEPDRRARRGEAGGGRRSRPAGRRQHRAACAAPEEEIFEQPSNSTTTRESSDTAPIIDLVDLVINSAITSRASDIHIEPMEKGVLVRHRLDGILKEVMDLPKWVHEGLVARMKIMGGNGHRREAAPAGRPDPGEDGRRHDVDFRVSTLRTLHGEKIVLRVLDQRKGAPPLEELGLSAADDGGAAVLPANTSTA